MDYSDFTPLWSSSAGKSVFNHPAWFQVMGKLQSSRGHKENCITTLDSEDRLCGFWPIITRRGAAKDLFAQIIEPLGAENTDYIAPVAADHLRDALMQATVEFIKREARWNSIISFPKLRIPDSEVDFLAAQFSSIGWLTHKQTRTISRMKFLQSWDEQSKTLSASHRGDVGRQLRRLREQGDLTLFIASSREDILANFDKMFEKHQSKWAKAGVASEFLDQTKRNFYTDLVNSLPFEHIHYSEVQLNGQAISYHFGFLDDGWILWYKPAYDIDYEKYSPGKVHIALMAQYGITKGLAGIDFLQGDEGYKRLWSNDAITTESLLMAPKSAYLHFIWQTRYRQKIRDFILSQSKKLLARS